MSFQDCALVGPEELRGLRDEDTDKEEDRKRLLLWQQQQQQQRRQQRGEALFVAATCGVVPGTFQRHPVSGTSLSTVNRAQIETEMAEIENARGKAEEKIYLLQTQMEARTSWMQRYIAC